MLTSSREDAAKPIARALAKAGGYKLTVYKWRTTKSGHTIFAHHAEYPFVRGYSYYELACELELHIRQRNVELPPDVRDALEAYIEMYADPNAWMYGRRI